jgi:type IV pilus assembly protein PilM
MGIFNLKPPPILGIDISSTAIKLVELSRAGAEYCVESYGIDFLPEKAVEDKTVAQPESVGSVIQRVVKKAKPKAQHVAVAVSGPAVITKVIQMAKGLSDNDIMSELEGSNYLGTPIEEVKMDFEVIGDNEKEPGRVDVLLAAARNENVDAVTEAIELGGLIPKVVDVEKYALENAFVLLVQSDPEISEEEAVALIEVGATTITINVLRKFKIVYSREDMFGGNRLTEDIQARYELSYEEATLAKRNNTLPKDYETDVLDPFREEVAQQISRMVQYYYAGEAASKHGKLSHILIAGGCSSIKNMEKEVSKKVGGRVSVANPFIRMSVSKQVDKDALYQDAPALMVACGLALRNFE